MKSIAVGQWANKAEGEDSIDHPFVYVRFFLVHRFDREGVLLGLKEDVYVMDLAW